MKVYFDHQIFSWQRYGGISRYFSNIYHSLHAHGHTDCKITLLYSRNHYIQDLHFPLPAFVAERLRPRQVKLESWNRKYSRYLIRKNDFDVLHPTFYDPYFLDGLKKPYVVTVHDMIHELFPEYFSQNDPNVPRKRTTIMRADHVIAISQSTKNDLQKIFGLPDEKITVIHHGYTESREAADPMFVPPFPNYLLFVGDRGGYKNFHRFVTAVQPLLSRYNIHLVCAGGGAFGVAEQEMLQRAGILDRTAQISATEGQLNALYQRAIAFVYPSLYEGFGLPLLEAFHNNCPIVASNTSCFHEVGGDAVSYFDPYQPDDMRRAIDAVINSADTAQQLREKGALQLRRFPMDRCMDRTMEVYRKLS